eukprot:COSAG05_NODE_4414_length_1525_cov_1.293128_2_plen_199_part_00
MRALQKQFCPSCRACAATDRCHRARSYGAAFCVCGVIIATEPELTRGIAWTVAVCLLGCPNACFWATSQLYTRGNLKLAESKEGDTDGHSLPERPVSRTVGIGFFPLYGVGFVVLLVVSGMERCGMLDKLAMVKRVRCAQVTFVNQNLFDLAFDDRIWCLWWLTTTCFDYCASLPANPRARNNALTVSLRAQTGAVSF